MTKYLLAVHTVEGVPNYESDEEMHQAFRDVAALNEIMRAEKAWVFGGGLHPVESATVVRAASDGGAVLSDGPFAEAKEHIGGFWIIEAPDLDAAIGWATKAARACKQPVEVRPFQDEPE